MSEHKCRCAGCTKAKKAGATEERERIIELLDSIGFHSTYLDDGSHTKDCDGCELVALIKGENE